MMIAAEDDLSPTPGGLRQRRLSRQASKAQGIYAHYKQKYQRIRERMQAMNLRQSIAGTGVPHQQLSFDLLPHSSTQGMKSMGCHPLLLGRRRYAASAPEINNEMSSSSRGAAEAAKDSPIVVDDEDEFENYASGDDEDDFEDEDERLMIDVTATTTATVANNNNNNNQTMETHRPPHKNLIQELIEVDRLEMLINLKGLQIRGGPPNPEETSAASLRLSRIGDEIVEQLVEWTKVLPFYNDLPVEVHTHLLTQRWSELVLLSACFYALCTQCDRADDVEMDQPSFEDSGANLLLFQRRLSDVMNKQIPFEHVSKEAGLLVEKLTALLNAFAKLNITLEAYVCLKAITLVHYGAPTTEDPKTHHFHAVYSKKVQIIQDQFVKALQIHLSQCENGPRLTDLFNFLPLLSSTATFLLNSKMFYVPFLICREPDRFIEVSEPRKDVFEVRGSPSQGFEAANSTSSSISDGDECNLDLSL